MKFFHPFQSAAASDHQAFVRWLDFVLSLEWPAETKAVNLNLYEDADFHWSAKWIGSSVFDESDDDWACHEVFSTREHPFTFVRNCDYTEIERLFSSWLADYLKTGTYAARLKQYQAVSLGFVDGDLNILYRR